MAVHPLRQRCGGYHEPTFECSYCRWIMQGDLEGLDVAEILRNYEATVDRPDPSVESTCPQCARFREKMDREKMAKVIDKVANADTGSVNLYDSECEDIASALIKYLTE